MEEKKLKYLYQRMPEKKVTIKQLTKEVTKITDYPEMHVETVIGELINLIEKNIVEKNQVIIPELGILYPTVKPGKNVVKINKYKEKAAELMYMPPRWICKFKVKASFAKKLLEIQPTEQEVNNIYKD